MDKNAIKTFAVESRRKMIKSVKFQASLLGITANEIKEPISKAEGMETYDYGAGQHTIYDEDIKKRESLVREINNKGFENVVEEVAYTWFNRIIAIRYMEVNDYLPTYTRVLSSEIEGKIEPDIITEALDLDLDYSDEDREKILKFKMDNDNDKLFQFLFIKQCNKLNEILPGLFEKTDDYMELLLDIKFTDEDSVVRQLVDTISEDDFKEQVEIIGWMYQYYISEKKDQVININKTNIKKEDIPAATQLFTTDWIVKYMVDNSLGRYWIERNPNSDLEDYLEYYLGEAEQDEETRKKLDIIRSEGISIDELTFFDPCMGSGHILVYAFDVFVEIYKELGYLESEIPELILKNNIFGLDIDERAYQLAYFAVLMKAREYDKNILKKEIVPNVYAIQESINITDDVISFIEKQDNSIVDDIIYLRKIFKSGKEFGSLIQVKEIDFEKLSESIQNIVDKFRFTLVDINIINIIRKDLISLINQAELLSNKYNAVVTNPPYMNKYDKNLRDFTKKYYKNYFRDLFSIFIYRNFGFCKKYGYNALMTPLVWMFLQVHEKLRKYIINNKNISSLIQLEYSAFSEATVPICTFILKNDNENYNGIYLRLSEFPGGMNVQKEKVLESKNNDVNYKYTSNIQNFKKIPGIPIAYWVSQQIINSFDHKNLGSISEAISGMTTGNNNLYLKLWYEVDFNKISLNKSSINEVNMAYCYWIPYNKGGSRRNWYGNNNYIINWSLNEEFHRAKTTCSHLYLKKGITSSMITSSKFSARFFGNGFLWDRAGSPIFFQNDEDLYYALGLLCTNYTDYLLKLINPTLSMSTGDLEKIPYIYDENKKDMVIQLVKSNIQLTKQDWDEFESSWDFKYHPYITFRNEQELPVIHQCYMNQKKEHFSILKQNEIELNKLFNEIYSIDLENSIEDKYVSITLADNVTTIKSFISYAVGCMFGRYSLDQEGLQFAGGEFNINNYSKFIPDDDNIIPVLDTEYFNDDIVGRFVEFVKVCFGEETLEENLDFIAGALKKKGKTSREIIRNYFLTDFFKDHAQTYKKCPIYWQFDSGKQNAFKCLIYMHRYEPGLVARVRTDYLHKTQKAIEQNLAQCESIIANSSNKSEVSKATKDKSKYIKQLDEIKVYDEALAHIANQRIEIDLDDGVKVNHAKFQNVEISKEGQKAKKINLLKKI